MFAQEILSPCMEHDGSQVPAAAPNPEPDDTVHTSPPCFSETNIHIAIITSLQVFQDVSYFLAF